MYLLKNKIQKLVNVNDQNSLDLVLDLFLEFVKEKGLELDCYSSYTAQALICEAVTEAATLLLGPAAALKNLSRTDKLLEIGGLTKTSKIVKKIELAEI